MSVKRNSIIIINFLTAIELLIGAILISFTEVCIFIGAIIFFGSIIINFALIYLIDREFIKRRISIIKNFLINL